MKLLGPSATLSATEVRDNLVLHTSDGKRYAAKRTVFLLSQLVQDLISSQEDSETSLEITLEDIDSATLYAVHEYLEHHQIGGPLKEIERPLRGELKTFLDPWDWKYVEDTLLQGGSNPHFVFSVLKAASFFSVGELRELCCASVAELLRTKNEEQLLEFFGVDSFTASDEEGLLKDFPWLAE